MREKFLNILFGSPAGEARLSLVGYDGVRIEIADPQCTGCGNEARKIGIQVYGAAADHIARFCISSINDLRWCCESGSVVMRRSSRSVMAS